MKNRPLIFTILSILCLVEPAIKLLYFKATTQFDFATILTNLKMRDGFFEVFDFWLVFPLAGALILKLRKWTYFGFMAVLSYIIYNIFTYEKYTWPYNSSSPFLYNYVVAFLSVGTFVYFLFPQVREPFFDRRVRWWEPKTRYNVQINCKLQTPNLTFHSIILNLSQTGAFLQETGYLKVGDRAVMEFNFLGQVIEVPVEVVHRQASRGLGGHGVRFVFKNYAQSVRMAKVINLIKKSHNSLSENSKMAA